MSDKQIIRAGKDSVNVQGRDVYVGMQYSEIRQLCLDLWHQNYETLVSDAMTEAQRRATELIDAFVDRLKDAPRELLANLADPGVQRALVQAEVEHASSGDSDAVDTYANLLMEKVAHPGKNMSAIACQQAIETVSQLTREHMDLLGCILIVMTSWSFASIEDARAKYVQFLEPMATGAVDNVWTLRYLDSTACLAYDTTRAYDYRQILQAVLMRDGGTIGSGDLVADLAGENAGVRTVVELFLKPDTPLKSAFLTNRGTAIAHAHIGRRHQLGPLEAFLRT